MGIQEDIQKPDQVGDKAATTTTTRHRKRKETKERGRENSVGFEIISVN